MFFKINKQSLLHFCIMFMMCGKINKHKGFDLRAFLRLLRAFLGVGGIITHREKKKRL